MMFVLLIGCDGRVLLYPLIYLMTLVLRYDTLWALPRRTKLSVRVWRPRLTYADGRADCESRDRVILQEDILRLR